MGMETPDTSSPPASPYLRHPFPWVPQPFPHAGLEEALAGQFPGARI